MARMQMNTAKGVLPGFSPTSDMESEQSQFKTNLQSLNESVNTIETDKDAHTATTKETVDRITSVEKILEEQFSTFANQSYIDTLDSPARSTDTESRLSQLESNQTSYQFRLQKLTTKTYTLQSEINANLTFLGDIIKAQRDTIVTLSNDIHQLEAIIIGQNASIHDNYERLSLFDANTTEFEGDLQSQDRRLKQLEKLLYIENITLQSHSSRIAAIELDQINDRVVLLNQTKRIGQLESGFINITTVVISQDSKITKLESDQIIDHDMILNNTIMNQLETYCNKNNSTLLAHISRIEQIELDQSGSLVVQANLTRKLNQIEKCSLHNKITVQAHDSRISILESGLALNKDVIGNHTSIIIEIETGLAIVNTTLQNLATSIEILESEQTSNPSDQTDDPTLMNDFLDYLIADVIPFQTISNNTRRIEKLENSTSDQDASVQDFIFNCTRGFNEVETNLANLNATLQTVITRIATLESEQTSNPPGEITDPDMVRDLLENLIEYLQDVIPFQAISNNTKRIEQLEYNTVDQDTTIIGLALEVNKTWNVIQDYSARSGNSTGNS